MQTQSLPVVVDAPPPGPPRWADEPPASRPLFSRQAAPLEAERSETAAPIVVPTYRIWAAPVAGPASVVDTLVEQIPDEQILDEQVPDQQITEDVAAHVGGFEPAAPAAPGVTPRLDGDVAAALADALAAVSFQPIRAASTYAPPTATPSNPLDHLAPPTPDQRRPEPRPGSLFVAPSQSNPADPIAVTRHIDPNSIFAHARPAASTPVAELATPPVEFNLAPPPVPERAGRFRFSWAGLVVVAAGAALIFEQSPANEALRVAVGLDVLERSRSALWVGVVIVAVTALIELVSSMLIAVGLHTQGGMVQRLRDRISSSGRAAIADDAEEQPSRVSGWSKPLATLAADVGIALGLGAGLVTMKRHIAHPNPTLRSDLWTSVRATTIVAGVSGLVGYLTAGGINRTVGTVLERPAQLVVDYGTNTRFWLAVVVGGYALALVWGQVRTRRATTE